ncbi:hypothetical protein I3760_05G033500 [Carya illinoinensis]|uniref:Uncharacterized protein n=1 Tax=Carya illinoinensis TaxID=32201 RepID=A0A8T1QEL2_CARIL|nr:uncharacterized protein LOC122311145 [Carya illinoinensis]KAG2705024.1 hypothetical protein I3760_05G033500 [Carya illinoinensis]KAG6652809.1 hypothetical protein CIPAW_05G032100 [Carya illinoinensis]KAG6711036.1 hypothetical protein I3842_05G033800 [Carya illinoinensis]
MLRTASVSCNLRSILQLLRHDMISCSSYTYRGYRPVFAVDKFEKGYWMNGGFRLFSTSTGGNWTKLDGNAVKFNHDNDKVEISAPAPAPAPAPSPPKFIFFRWAKWILGSLLAFSLPMWNRDWGKLRRIEGEAEMVVEEVEIVAEVVEKVATVAENVSAEFAEKLPEDGKLKEAALFVERVSKEAAHDAQLTTDFIHKVDVLKEDLEALVEPVIDKISKQESEAAGK